MSNLIASQISVTTGDIAKAAVGAAKQQLAINIKALDTEHETVQNKFKEQFATLVLQKVKEVTESAAYADFTKCAKIFTKYNKDSDYDVSITIEDRDTTHAKFIDLAYSYWAYNFFMLGRADNKKSIRQNRQNKLDIYLNVTFSQQSDREHVEYVVSSQVDTIDLTAFLDENKNTIDHMVEVWNKSIDLSNKLKGHQDPITNMTLEEEITNAITMQAVSKLPDIAAVFDTAALAGSIINGYLE